MYPVDIRFINMPKSLLGNYRVYKNISKHILEEYKCMEYSNKYELK